MFPVYRGLPVDSKLLHEDFSGSCLGEDKDPQLGHLWLVDDFDSDYAVQVCIPGTVDRTLPTLAYPLEDFVSAYTLEHGCREL